VALVICAPGHAARLPTGRRSGFPPGTAQPVLRTVGESQRFSV